MFETGDNDAAAPGGDRRRPSVAAATTDALLLNCIDFRLAAATTRYMTARGMDGRYDQMALAGAALGACNDRFPGWGRTFREHVQVAIDLHRIRKLIILDHRDCGAYRVILGEDLAADPSREHAVHAAQLRRLCADIARDHPELAVELLLMALDGSVETIA